MPPGRRHAFVNRLPSPLLRSDRSGARGLPRSGRDLESEGLFVNKSLVGKLDHSVGGVDKVGPPLQAIHVPSPQRR